MSSRTVLSVMCISMTTSVMGCGALEPDASYVGGTIEQVIDRGPAMDVVLGDLVLSTPPPERLRGVERVILQVSRNVPITLRSGDDLAVGSRADLEVGAKIRAEIGGGMKLSSPPILDAKAIEVRER